MLFAVLASLNDESRPKGKKAVNDNNDDLPGCWPREGDCLFRQDERGYDTEIAACPAERSYRMKEAFKEAADLLVNHAEEKRGNVSRNMVWPIVFCYRQYIELALKDVIAKHGNDVEPSISSNWKKHPGKKHLLRPLWESCKKIMAATLVNTTVDEIPEIAAVEACINEFDEIDDGYSFRFPTDAEGKPIEISIPSVDLQHLQEVMDCLYAFFDATESVLNMFFGDSW